MNEPNRPNLAVMVNIAILVAVILGGVAVGLHLGAKAGLLTQRADLIAHGILWMTAASSAVIAIGGRMLRKPTVRGLAPKI